MGLIADALRRHVHYGDQCQCGCGSGVSAATPTRVHTVEQEEFLVRRGVELGLINSPVGAVDPNVDNIPWPHTRRS